MLRNLGLSLLVVTSASACLAAPPPIGVDTPYGQVRAETEVWADEIAGLLRLLAPRVQEMLPGSLERPVDVWVQRKLRIYENGERAANVRGFTLLLDEFQAERIHLQEGGQPGWYLAHELVHALIGPTWRPLPGILEEGLGDVLAERLNPHCSAHIRAHRLLNASVLTGGLDVRVSYSVPEQGVDVDDWERRVGETRVNGSGGVPTSVIRELLTSSRRDLHARWSEIPESFYGLAWLIASRIVERHGLEGMHELCLDATREGHELVPLDWILSAAELDLERMDAVFLASCFGRSEMRAATRMRAGLFADGLVDLLADYDERFATPRSLLYWMDPAIRLTDGDDVHMRRIRALSDAIERGWTDERSRLDGALISRAPAGDPSETPSRAVVGLASSPPDAPAE